MPARGPRPCRAVLETIRLGARRGPQDSPRLVIAIVVNGAWLRPLRLTLKVNRAAG